jgi:hypothetical protein
MATLHIQRCISSLVENWENNYADLVAVVGNMKTRLIKTGICKNKGAYEKVLVCNNWVAEFLTVI